MRSEAVRPASGSADGTEATAVRCGPAAALMNVRRFFWSRVSLPVLTAGAARLGPVRPVRAVGGVQHQARAHAREQQDRRDENEQAAA
ncbi:hypothetical protein RKD27_001304 [Streptomyces sp. SAI-126]